MTPEFVIYTDPSMSYQGDLTAYLTADQGAEIDWGDSYTDISDGSVSSHVYGSEAPYTITVKKTRSVSLSSDDPSVGLHARIYTGIKWPKWATEIPANCFRGCVHINDLELPETVEEIGEYAFSELGNQEFTIPFSVKRIPKGCFANCVNLAFLTVYNVEKIDSSAFSGATSLESVFCPGGTDALSALWKNTESPGNEQFLNALASSVPLEKNDIFSEDFMKSISVFLEKNKRLKALCYSLAEQIVGNERLASLCNLPFVFSVPHQVGFPESAKNGIPIKKMALLLLDCFGFSWAKEAFSNHFSDYLATKAYSLRISGATLGTEKAFRTLMSAMGSISSMEITGKSVSMEVSTIYTAGNIRWLAERIKPAGAIIDGITIV